MTNRNNDKPVAPPPHDELDGLLRAWHAESADLARAGRDRLFESIAQADRERPDASAATVPRPAARVRGARSWPDGPLARLPRRPWLRAAASLILVVTFVALLVPMPGASAVAQTIMAPEAGRLEALDPAGHALGICPLQHTDVDVSVSGRFTRVTLRQTFTNPHPHKIEAVYTFPLSHRGAVDRMQMTIGDRVVVGEVKERKKARRVYESARARGYVASLLEQERPNVFTQSVANIEPGAEIEVEISYVEVLEVIDGVYRFDFPMVVAPRYVPGAPSVSRALLPEELKPRYGIILRGPARLTLGAPGDTTTHGALQPGGLQALLAAAQPIEYPGVLWWGEEPEEQGGGVASPPTWYPFVAEYAGGAKESGVIATDGTGHVNGRYFYTEPAFVREMGTGFAPDTDQVPDASRVTPMPVRPPTRAGHDIALAISIDTGGPAIAAYRSELHAVHEVRGRGVGERGPRLALRLVDDREIPNRDFVLEWRVAGDTIEASHFVHTRPSDEDDDDTLGGFFTLILDPPARVDDVQLRARELIFVLDCSGSMEGFPIEKAKSVLSRALATMRPGDRFNVVTFNDSTEVLWDVPRRNTDENRAAAQTHLDARQGGGGTEMRPAVLAALSQPEIDDVEWPRARYVLFLSDGEVANDDAVIEAVRAHAGRSRMFTIAIGSSPNRWILDAMAAAGRGAADYVSLEGDAEAAVRRFVHRIDRPVLTDIELEFGAGLEVVDCIPPIDAVPDLFDERPLVIHGRYGEAGAGVVTIRGNTAEGPYERVVPLELPRSAPEHDVIATLWARARVGELEKAGDPAPIIALGEAFRILTKHTSFVAVERSRVTIDGRPMLVAIPVEMPEGQSWGGTFGGQPEETVARRLIEDKTSDAGYTVTPPAANATPVTLGIDFQFAPDAGAKLYFFDGQSSSFHIGETLRRRQEAEPAPVTIIDYDNLSFGIAPTQTTERQVGLITQSPVDEGAVQVDQLNDRLATAATPATAGRDAGLRSAVIDHVNQNSTSLETAQQVGDLRRSFDVDAAERLEWLEFAKKHEAGATPTLARIPLAEEFFTMRPPATPPSAPGVAYTAEHLILIIEQQVSAGELDAARRNAETLATRRPDVDLGLAAHATLGDTSLGQSERAEAIGALAATAQERIDAALADVRRAARLRRVLDSRFWSFIDAADRTGTPVEPGDEPAPDGTTWRDGGFLVTVLVTETTTAARAKLEDAGLAIKGWVRSAPVVVGVVPPGRLVDLAETGGVRRIEPTRWEVTR